MKRVTAFKLPICEIVEGDYNKTEKEDEANYLLTKSGFRISRAKIWGNVSRVFESTDKPFKSITLDDFTQTISLLAFDEKVSVLDGIKVGDVVTAIGKPREGRDEIFLLAETVKKINPTEEMLCRAENIHSMKTLKKEESDKKADEKPGSEKIDIEKNVI